MKTIQDTLLLGVIYPEAEKYFLEYCSSIQTQDYQEFDVLILNDHCRRRVGIKKDEWKFIDIKKNLSTAQIRSLGIKYALENNYRYLVLTDVDDYFSRNRVSLSKQRLRYFDFVYNDLDLVNSEGRIIKKDYLSALSLDEEYSNILPMIDKNLLGLSNTAVRVEKLKGLEIPKEIIAVDWWIFTLLLLQGYKGGYIEDAVTYYRQTGANIVGMGKPLTEERLHVGVKVKSLHYKNVAEFCSRNNLEEEAIYRKKFEEMEKLGGRLKNAKFKRRYVQLINKNFKEIFIGWWSEILPLKEWEKYV